MLRTPTLLALLLTTACSWDSELVATLDAALPAEDLQRLEAETGIGSLIISGREDATEIEVVVDVWRHGPHLRPACDPDEFELELEDLADGSARLLVRGPDDRPNYSLDVEVVLPSRLDLDVWDELGDLEIDHVASLVLEDGLGDVDISDIAGELVVQDGSGGMYITGVTGDIEVIDDLGDIVISEVIGDVEITDGLGEIRVSHVTGDVVIRDASGDIRADDVGSLEVIEDTTGDVRHD